MELRALALGPLLWLLLHAPALGLRQARSAKEDVQRMLSGHGVPRSRGIQVIGAGAPRTGTQSMQRALTILGYQTAHEEFLLYNKTAREQWRNWAHGGSFEPAAQALLDAGMTATTGDDPWGFAVEELMARFPNAKVVLSVHPKGPRGWMASVEKSLPRSFTQYTNTHDNKFSEFWRYVYENCHIFRGCPINETMTDDIRERCMSDYARRIERVRQIVPKERLLEFNLADGWKPLCEFLGRRVPPPWIRFPHCDDQLEIIKNPDKQAFEFEVTAQKSGYTGLGHSRTFGHGDSWNQATA